MGDDPRMNEYQCHDAAYGRRSQIAYTGKVCGFCFEGVIELEAEWGEVGGWLRLSSFLMMELLLFNEV